MEEDILKRISDFETQKHNEILEYQLLELKKMYMCLNTEQQNMFNKVFGKVELVKKSSINTALILCYKTLKKNTDGRNDNANAKNLFYE